MEKQNYYQLSLDLHRKLKGKIEITSKIKVDSKEILSQVYTPGVAQPCKEISLDKSKAYDYTIKSNTVAVVSDGSAVLGLGNIGASAAIPVMEGKALIFKEFAGIDAFPICIESQKASDIIKVVRNITPVFGAVNLEDIAAPKCFEVESKLQDLGIPVMHDDQHGTAIVVLAALINASKIVGKDLTSMKVVISGSGAAGTAIAKMLLCLTENKMLCTSVKDVIVVDRKGIISSNRKTRLNLSKKYLLEHTNSSNVQGDLQKALIKADVFIGVSSANIVSKEMIASMAKDSIVFALANPEPEINPNLAFEGGARIVATGRSDYPNQINNALSYPSVFKGALDSRAKIINDSMKLAAAYALAGCVQNPSETKLLPSVLDKSIIPIVSKAVFKAAIESSANK